MMEKLGGGGRKKKEICLISSNSCDQRLIFMLLSALHNHYYSASRWKPMPRPRKYFHPHSYDVNAGLIVRSQEIRPNHPNRKRFLLYFLQRKDFYERTTKI